MKSNPPFSAGSRRATRCLAALAAAATLTVSLTACGGDKPGAAGTTSRPAGTGTSTPKATPLPTTGPYALTTDGHVIPGQDVGKRYSVARLAATTGTEICGDNLLGPTPDYVRSPKGSENDNAHQAAFDAVWKDLARGVASEFIALDSSPITPYGNPRIGVAGCRTELRNALPVFDGPPYGVIEGQQDVVCASTVTASTKTADQLLRAGVDLNYFGSTPDPGGAVIRTSHAQPVKTVREGGLNLFLFVTCGAGGTPRVKFLPASYRQVTSDARIVGDNMLAAMRRHLAP